MKFKMLCKIENSLRNFYRLSSKLKRPKLTEIQKISLQRKMNVIAMRYENKILFGPVDKGAKKKKSHSSPLRNSESLDNNSNISEASYLSNEINSKAQSAFKLEEKESKPSYESAKKIDIASKIINEPPSEIDFVNNESKHMPSNFYDSKILNFPLYDTMNNSKKTTISDKIQSISMFEGDKMKLPSVKKILNETQSPEQKAILEKWKKNMIKKLGKSEFEIYQQNLLNRGILLHGCLDLLLKEKLEPSNEQLVGIEHLWSSVSHVLPKISQVKAFESKVVHPHLHYYGMFDCLAMYKDKLVLIEFKTSTKPKLTLQSTFDDPLQTVAYLGALNYDKNYSLPRIDGALLVVAYPTGLPAHAHFLTKDDCCKYWNFWLRRLKQFWMMQSLS